MAAPLLAVGMTMARVRKQTLSLGACFRYQIVCMYAYVCMCVCGYDYGVCKETNPRIRCVLQMPDSVYVYVCICVCGYDYGVCKETSPRMRCVLQMSDSVYVYVYVCVSVRMTISCV
jgi:hypothetical protein